MKTKLLGCVQIVTIFYKIILAKLSKICHVIESKILKGVQKYKICLTDGEKAEQIYQSTF